MIILVINVNLLQLSLLLVMNGGILALLFVAQKIDLTNSLVERLHGFCGVTLVTRLLVALLGAACVYLFLTRRPLVGIVVSDPWRWDEVPAGDPSDPRG